MRNFPKDKTDKKNFKNLNCKNKLETANRVNKKKVQRRIQRIV